MTTTADRLKKQDAEAWNSFYDQHLDTVYGFVFRLVRGNRQVADDLFQEVWLSAIENIETYEAERGELSAWLFGIARRRVALYWRRTLSREHQIEFQENATPETVEQTLLPIEAMERVERAELVNAALLVMAENQRQVLRLKYNDGLSVDEIAKRCGKSPKATESLLSRSRERLRSLLGRVLDDALSRQGPRRTK